MDLTLTSNIKYKFNNYLLKLSGASNLDDPYLTQRKQQCGSDHRPLHQQMQDITDTRSP